jgi:hypothetical protein
MIGRILENKGYINFYVKIKWSLEFIDWRKK